MVLLERHYEVGAECANRSESMPTESNDNNNMNMLVASLKAPKGTPLQMGSGAILGKWPLMERAGNVHDRFPKVDS